MNITKEQITDLISMMSMADDFKPLLKEALKIVESYSVEFKDLIDNYRKYARESKVENIKYYEAMGLSKDQAILLTIDSEVAIRRLSNKMNYNKK